MCPIDQLLKGYDYILVHLLKQMLQWDPAARPSIRQCLEHPFFNMPSHDTKSAQCNLVDTEKIYLKTYAQRLFDDQITLEQFKQWFQATYME